MVHRLRKKRAEMGVANLDIIRAVAGCCGPMRGRWRWNVILRAGAIQPGPSTVRRCRAGGVVDVDPVTFALGRFVTCRSYFRQG